MNRRAVLPIMITCGALAGAIAWTRTSNAATIVVDTTAQSTKGDAFDGHCSLGEAMASADGDLAIDTCTKGSGDDDITLPAGTYTFTKDWDPVSPSGRALPIMYTNVSVHGAGATTTILQQTSGTMDDLFQVQPSAKLELDNVAVTVGHTTGPSPWGLAIVWDGATITLDHVDAHDLETTGIRFFTDLRNSTGHFTSFQYRNNHMPVAPGGAGAGSTTIVVTDSTFTNNDAPYLFGQPAVTISLVRSTFDGNKGNVGLFSVADLTVTDCVFTNNDTTAIPNVPGVIRIGSGTTSITGSTFDGNKGSFGGALAFNGTTTFTVDISTSTFHGNVAKRGGAIDLGSSGSGAPGTLSIENSTFSGNSATAFAGDPTSGCGGAISSDAEMSLTTNDVTISANAADTQGGGICVWRVGGSGTVSLTNTILAGNFSGSTPWDCATVSPLTVDSGGYVLFGAPTSCTITAGTGDQIGTTSAPLDPKLAPYGDYGGKTKAMPPYASSSAVGAGNPAATGAGACLPTDQEDATRPAGGCTIGAIQTTVADPTPDAGVDASDAADGGAPDTFVADTFVADTFVADTTVDAFDAAKPDTTPADAAFDVFNETGHDGEKVSDDGCSFRATGRSDDSDASVGFGAGLAVALVVAARKRRAGLSRLGGLCPISSRQHPRGPGSHHPAPHP